MKEKKLICPKCKMEIDHLDFDVTGSCSAQIYKDDVKKNIPADYDIDCLTDGVEFDNFRCPECQENLFVNGGNEQDQAIAFLKGK